MDQPNNHHDQEGQDDNQIANTTNESNNGDANNRSSTKKEQFTTKQRLDMYAFCVLELEIHGNTVSMKKRHQAIQKALSTEQLKTEKKESTSSIDLPDETDKHPNIDQNTSGSEEPTTSAKLDSLAKKAAAMPAKLMSTAEIVELTEQEARQLQENGALVKRLDCRGSELSGPITGLMTNDRTLDQLQQQLSLNLKCYSDFQKTQVLTSSMLRSVQVRFAKYYPDSVIPSRTTIKHVFEKCVAYGTVDNIKNPRKPSKFPKGCEIEELLTKEPQLSLRQLAARLKVSVGTISRRCKALGLIPESVTIKHQQLAIARRQKQVKQQSNSPSAKNTQRRRNQKTLPNGSNSR